MQTSASPGNDPTADGHCKEFTYFSGQRRLDQPVEQNDYPLTWWGRDDFPPVFPIKFVLVKHQFTFVLNVERWCWSWSIGRCSKCHMADTRIQSRRTSWSFTFLTFPDTIHRKNPNLIHEWREFTVTIRKLGKWMLWYWSWSIRRCTKYDMAGTRFQSRRTSWTVTFLIHFTGRIQIAFTFEFTKTVHSNDTEAGKMDVVME